MGKAPVTDKVLQMIEERFWLAHIRNVHQTTTVTTTSHQSREMVVSLG
jgi:hypothetical protein